MSFSTIYKTGLLTIALFCSIITVGFAQSYSEYSYTENTSTNLVNPERGFYVHTETSSPSYSLLKASTLQGYRNQGYSLILRVWYLTEFVSSDISQTYLNNMQSDFNAMRIAGIKAVIRFAYTKKSTPPYGDATPEWTTKHIAQLKNILHENADVISVVQVGFIGAWGEWYYTDHFGTGGISATQWDYRRNLVYNLLNAVPKNRFVQLRTPSQKMKVTGVNTPLTTEEAFNQSDISRMAHHNDCFLASANDVGTYNSGSITAEKAYLEEETKYLPMGGETCGVSPPYSQCPNAVAEMKRFHWSYLNSGYHGSVLNSWKTDGCMDDVLRKLGYRIRLVKTNLQTASKPGGVANFSITLINDGWAAPYNKRDVELVLRNKSNNKEYTLALNEDPRRWPLDEEFTINVEAGLPKNIMEGNYDIFLNLPDPEPSIKNDPNFSIQLANTNTWESTSGYNKLGHTITVSNATNVPTYTGSSYFLSALTIQEKKNIIIDQNFSDWNDIEPAIVSKDYDGVDMTLKLYAANDSIYMYIHADYAFPMNVEVGVWIPGSDEMKFYDYFQNAKEFKFASSFFKDGDYTLDSLIFGYITAGAPANSVKVAVPLVEGEKLRSTSSGNQVHLYWTNGIQKTSRVIQRSDDGGNVFKTIAIVGPNQFTYTDAVEGDSVYYRTYQTTENLDAISVLTEVVKVPLSAKPPYYTYARNEDVSEWDNVAPVFTAKIEEQFFATRFQITADSLHIAFEDYKPTQFEIYLNWDNDSNTGISGNEYLLETNKVSVLNSEVQTPFTTVSNNGYHEIAIPLSVFTPIANDASIRLSIVLPDILESGSILFQRTPPAGKISGLVVENSTLQPETMLNVSWSYCENCSGYRVDRSTDGVTFETIAHKTRNTVTTHYDNNLTPGQVYTYRISGYNDLGVVLSSETKTLATKLILSAEKGAIDGYVYPNPTHGPIVINTLKNASTFKLFDAKGNHVKANVLQTIEGFVSLDIAHLPTGLYILKAEDNTSYRIIKQ
jgi:hypothetical protein